MSHQFPVAVVVVVIKVDVVPVVGITFVVEVVLEVVLDVEVTDVDVFVVPQDVRSKAVITKILKLNHINLFFNSFSLSIDKTLIIY